MHKGPLKNFFLAKTTHRFPKLVTLGVATSLLVSMVAIDASASPRIARNPNSVGSAFVLKLANETNNRPFSHPVRRRPPVTTSTTVSGTSTSTSVGASNGGASSPTTSSPPTTSTTSAPPTVTTTAPPTTTTSPSASTGGSIIAGPSRSECLEPNTPSGVYTFASLLATVGSFEQETNSTVTCLLAYLNSSQTWTDWQDPWIANGAGGEYTSWIAQSPQTRQLVLQVDLIPQSLKNTNDPLGWEQSCAAGNFNAYATQLGKNLVAAGLQNSVIRLGAEMNGGWENDFIGTTTQEMNLWATCFANEVTGLRQASGEHFLIDWNPNACTQSVPYSNFYPGNAYVDIMGLDLYDADCWTPTTPVSFSTLANENYGLNTFEAFAGAQGKPMSFPEWGLSASPSGDDPAYIAGIGSTVANNDFAFEAYFDVNAGVGLVLGPGTPLSVVAFQKWFGN
jgi:Glycosyl hydrolase family 26